MNNGNNTTGNTSSSINTPTPFALTGSHYSYAALLDEDGNEQPITESMIRLACEQLLSSLSVQRNISIAAVQAS